MLLTMTLGAAWATDQRAMVGACAPPIRQDDGWGVSLPAEADVDGAALCRVLDNVGAGKGGLHGLVIERHGKLLAEVYRTAHDQPMDRFYGAMNPFGGDTAFGPAVLHDTRSVSKSVVGMLVGIELGKGVLGPVERPVLDFLPELADLATPQRRAINLAHLLSMSSGLDWDEGGLPNDETRLYWKAAPDHFVFDRDVVHTPGDTFGYDSGGVAVLADIVVRRSGKTLSELARTELFEPMGITQWQWVRNLHSVELAFTGLRMLPRDMVKLGRLMLDHGRWQGRQLVPEAWVAETLKPRLSTGIKTPSDVPEAMQYGYLWWMGSLPWQGRYVRWWAAFGNGGQRIYLVPDLDMVVVMTAGAYGSHEIVDTETRLLERILAAVGPGG